MHIQAIEAETGCVRLLGLDTLTEGQSTILIGYCAASCARSGLRSFASNRRLRWVETSLRSASPMRVRNAVRVVSANRSPRSWLGCLTRYSTAIEQRGLRVEPRAFAAQ